MQTKKYFSGLGNSAAKAYFVLNSFLLKGKNAAFLCETDTELVQFKKAALAFIAVAGLKDKTEIIYFGETKEEQSLALYRLKNLTKTALFLCPHHQAGHLVAGKEQYQTQTLKTGQEISRASLTDMLENLGYERAEFTEGYGEYAIRGSVTDIYSPEAAHPSRIFFSGNKIESIRTFAIDTQESLAPQTELLILPLQKGLTPLSSWLNNFSIISDETTYLAKELPLIETAKEITVISDVTQENAKPLKFKKNLQCNGDFKLAAKEMQRFKTDGYTIYLSVLNEGELNRFREIFQNFAVYKNIKFIVTDLEEGLIAGDDKTVFFTTAEILSRTYSRGKLLSQFEVLPSKRVRFKDIKQGDYIVHEEYGIGKYIGLKSVSAGGEDIECMILEYTGKHRLYIPLYEFNRLQKYIGSEGRTPRLSSLNSQSWNETKNRVKENVAEIARQLLKTQAQRVTVESAPLLGDPRLEKDLEASFPYTETPDQTSAINQVLADLTLTRPMDRVLAGDVGFGKTEVAIRAAFRCAVSGKQTVILVPTTVLAAQHYKTFKARLAAFPVNIAMLSRFQNKTQQKQIVKDINSGLYDIIIGTHRILSKDLRFKNTGLCIIDEEHRFGVKQKERLKEMFKSVHTLTMSATPIPRTLHQSLSGLRQISLIETPPKGRMPIETAVTPYNENIISDAIRKEVGRAGQVFYVYNEVKTIDTKLAHLKRLMPEIKFGVGHGQMNETLLEKTMWDFYEKKHDVLLASTIIESGIDISDVNTLIVENAHELGLAQLYQLRGRIGRGDKKAYAFLMYPSWLKKAPALIADEEDVIYANENYIARSKPKKTKTQVTDITVNARQRLDALMEFGELGSGFRLAMRDLEIRGAGELLGFRQHGFMNAIGFSLYCDLLDEAVKQLHGKKIKQAAHCEVVLPVPALIPESYLPDETERLKYYKRLLSAREDQITVIMNSLEDMCGPAPQSVKNIAEVMRLRLKGAALKLTKIEYKPIGYEFIYENGAKLPRGLVDKLLNHYSDKLTFLNTGAYSGIRIKGPSGDYFNFINKTLDFLRSTASKC